MKFSEFQAKLQGIIVKICGNAECNFCGVLEPT